MMASKSLYAVAIILAGLSGSAMAAGAPAAVLNKTITISFTATGNAKSAEGKTIGFNTSVTRTIYVSSVGRLFMRHVASNRSGTRGGDFDPNDARQGKGSFHFEGNKLVGVIPYSAGARQITATFDSGFSSCTASIIEGHSNGVIQRKGPNGVMYEITSGSTTAPSCSVQAGNTFAN